MPDLKPVFVELRRRMSLHEDVFRRSVNSTDAKGREMYVAQGWLASWPTGQPRGSETSDGSAAGG